MNYLFLSANGHKGVVLSADNLQKAATLFLSKWNEQFFEEWKFEQSYLETSFLYIYSKKRNSILKFYILEFKEGESKIFQFYE